MFKDGAASVEIAEAEEEVDEAITGGEEPAVVLEVIEAEAEARVVVVVKVEEEGMEYLVGSKPSRSSRKMAPHLAKDEHIPALAIEYKAPHKLTRDEIVGGLAQDIHPFKEVIDKDSDDSDFCSKWLVTAIITQLFFYMVVKRV
ncbi:hypothetical protein RJ035_003797 [Blastomyces gilchristii]